jgi:hypothetical protein
VFRVTAECRGQEVANRRPQKLICTSDVSCSMCCYMCIVPFVVPRRSGFICHKLNKK